MYKYHEKIYTSTMNLCIQTNILYNVLFIFEKCALTLIIEYYYSLTYIFRALVSKTKFFWWEEGGGGGESLKVMILSS